MKKFFFFFTICLWLATSLTSAQQIMAQPPENILPSERTAQEISQLPAELSRPELRARPGSEPGDGNAQKVMLGDASWLMAIIALLLYAAYRMVIKKIATMKIRKIFFYRIFKPVGLDRKSVV